MKLDSVANIRSSFDTLEQAAPSLTPEEVIERLGEISKAVLDNTNLFEPTDYIQLNNRMNF